MREPSAVSTLSRQQQRALDRALSKHNVVTRHGVRATNAETADDHNVMSVFGGRNFQRSGDGGQVAAGGRTAEPLGTSQSYRPTSGDQPRKAVPQDVADARLEKRWGQLRGLRKLSSKERVRKCKTPIGNGRVGFTGHEGGAHLTGLESCGNVWACPVCSPKIRAGRTSDVLLAFDRHAANGGGFAFLTLTVAHEHGEGLAMLLQLLGGAWKSVAEQREYKEWRTRLGLIGSITALEVTDGQNSWHPHRHVMLLTERPLSRDEVAAFESVLDELYGRWLTKRGRKRGGVDATSGRRVGVRLDYVAPGSREQLGRYITKVQASYELTRGDLKMSRAAADGKGRLPLDILDDAMAGGIDASQARARWREYEQAMTGKSSCRFSKGLRKHLGMEKAKTDQQLAEEEVGGKAGLYAAAPLYRRLFRDGYVPTALRVYRSGGDLAVLAFVEAKYPGQYVGDETEYDGLVLFLRPRGKPN